MTIDEQITKTEAELTLIDKHPVLEGTREYYMGILSSLKSLKQYLNPDHDFCIMTMSKEKYKQIIQG